MGVLCLSLEQTTLYTLFCPHLKLLTIISSKWRSTSAWLWGTHSASPSRRSTNPLGGCSRCHLSVVHLLQSCDAPSSLATVISPVTAMSLVMIDAESDFLFERRNCAISGLWPSLRFLPCYTGVVTSIIHDVRYSNWAVTSRRVWILYFYCYFRTAIRCPGVTYAAPVGDPRAWRKTSCSILALHE